MSREGNVKKETIERAQALDKAYFGDRPLDQLVAVLSSQMRAMERELTTTNIRRQSGDLLFVLVAMARSKGWELDELLDEATTKIANRREGRHYYEAHVTIEPAFGARLELFRALCQAQQFHVATLVMRKRKTAKPKSSDEDAFCTGRSISYSDIEVRMFKLVASLKENGFIVRRYKIENTVLDSRHDDSRFELPKEWLPEKERNPKAPAAGALPGRRNGVAKPSTQ